MAVLQDREGTVKSEENRKEASRMNANRVRIEKLQEEMAAAGMDMYLVSTADFHQSEIGRASCRERVSVLV